MWMFKQSRVRLIVLLRGFVQACGQTIAALVKALNGQRPV